LVCARICFAIASFPTESFRLRNASWKEVGHSEEMPLHCGGLDFGMGVVEWVSA